MKKKRLLLILLFLLFIPAGALVISPYPRQLMFGPKIQGVPLCAWQESYRNMCAGKSFDLTSGFGWFERTTSPDWRSLTVSDRERIHLTLIRDPDVAVRKQVARGLLESTSKAALDAFIEYLADEDVTIREAAAWSMETWKPRNKELVLPLVRLLSDPSPSCRRNALDALNQINPRVQTTLTALVSGLSDGDERVRSTAGHCLQAAHWRRSRMAQVALPTLKLLMQSGDAARRLEIAQIILHINPTDEASLHLLLNSLENTTPQIRSGAAYSLLRYGGELPDKASTMLVKLASGDPVADVRANALLALTKSGAKAVPTMVNGLNDTDPHVRRWSVFALRQAGANAKEAVPALLALWDRSDKGMGQYVIQTLGNIGPEAKQASSRLRALVKQPDEFFQRGAAVALAKIKMDLPTVVPMLLEILKQPDWTWYGQAAEALGSLQSEAAVEILLAQLHEKRISRYPGPAAPGRLQAWPFGVVSPEPNDAFARFVHRSAIKALGRIGLEGTRVVPVITSFLANEDQLNRQEAARALGRFGSEARSAIPALIPLLDDDDLDLADAAAEALAKIDPARFAKKKGSP